jgi:hypothetical protein
MIVRNLNAAQHEAAAWLQRMSVKALADPEFHRNPAIYAAARTN